MGLLNRVFSKTKNKVYICYDDADEASAVNACSALEKNELNCWIKSRDASGNLVDSMMNAIVSSSLIVLVYSASCESSSYVRTEIDTAFARQIPILVFNIDGSQLTPALKLFLDSQVWIDAASNPDNCLEVLADFADRILNKKAVPRGYVSIKKSAPCNAAEVFISYSTRDREIADAVCNYLESNGVKCWIAPRDLKTGSNYAEEISNQISNAKIDLVISSESSNKSVYVKQEMEMAFRQQKMIIAFKIDESLPGGDFQFLLNNSQWIEAYSDFSGHFQELLDAVTRHLATLQSGNENEESNTNERGNEMSQNKIKTKSHNVDPPFEAYDGEGFIFASYKHADRDMVYPILKRLHDDGYRIWYDAGLPRGANYVLQIQSRIKKSSLFMNFITQNLMDNAQNPADFCFLEFQQAVKSDIESILPIHLEDVEMDGIYEFYTDKTQGILKFEFGDDEEGFISSIEHALERDFGILPDGSDVSKPEVKEESPEEEDYSGALHLPGPAYVGDGPYMYISYSHRDAKTVFPEVKRIMDLGYGVWYDEGLSAANNWMDDIVNRIDNSSLFVVFISKNYASSKFIKKELNFAIKNQIPVLPIYLDDVDDVEVNFLLGNVQGISKNELDDEQYIDRLTALLDSNGLRELSSESIDIFGIDYSFRNPDCDIYRLGEIIYYRIGFNGGKQFSQLSDEEYFKWEANAIRALCVAKAGGWDYPDDLVFNKTDGMTLDLGQNLYRVQMQSLGWTSGKYDYNNKTIDLSSLYHYPEEQALLRIVDSVKNVEFKFR